MFLHKINIAHNISNKIILNIVSHSQMNFLTSNNVTELHLGDHLMTMVWDFIL